MEKIKRVAIAMAIGSVTACGNSGPTAPTEPPANVAASYATTVTASSTCAANLPIETRALDFLAEITQAGSAIQVKLIAHVPGVPELSFSGTVSGQTVNFSNFTFNQTMGRGAALTATGSANLAANGLTMTGSLNGTYQTSSGASCNAANHQVQMVKLCLTPTATGTAMLPCQQ
jgi:predicted small lipoprotein YifL